MKKILMLFFSIILSFGMVSCSSSSDYKNVSTSKIEKALKSSDLLIKESKFFDAKEFNYFNDVEEDIIQGFVINSSEKLYLEDIIVIKTDDVNKIYKTLENYKRDMIQAPFGEGHGEKNNSEIANSTIVEKAGKYVYLISAENVSQIENKILSIIKK
ncbi:DUF4358 domain-containing protein [Clostridioides sp. ES-S-0005-03]|uniref:DUF4358 domain-containing protein n=1 Tax=unclassified Clostridioides TaxID=2635829 RepID=UPI001D124B51|nr:DUF4358 domain-containing protein [Clostridioides sp. ES-S-0145-01]MCC0680500.1 DUF4358 domain-containing protein [Clostridioides sp. ES-S-0005-03]UDN46719.1 DUF4358 domain-containing protein [Clostridioides sp. ES-S-0173-01]